MRYAIFSLMLAAAAASGCDKSTASASGNALTGDATTTAGRADAARKADAPTSREVTIPAGTQLTVMLDTAVGSDTSRVEEPVAAHLTRPIHVHGDTVLAEGSRITGVVTDATRSAKVKGRAHVAMRFDSLTPHGDDQRYAIQTTAVGRTAEGTKEKDALEIGAPAAGGAIVGALLGGKKGALVGTAVGGGAGTAVVLSTRGKEVHLGKGAPLTLKLAAPLTVRVRG